MGLVLVILWPLPGDCCSNTSFLETWLHLDICAPVKMMAPKGSVFWTLQSFNSTQHEAQSQESWLLWPALP